jgi:hypothetical protein
MHQGESERTGALSRPVGGFEIQSDEFHVVSFLIDIFQFVQLASFDVTLLVIMMERIVLSVCSIPSWLIRERNRCFARILPTIPLRILARFL